MKHQRLFFGLIISTILLTGCIDSLSNNSQKDGSSNQVSPINESSKSKNLYSLTQSGTFVLSTGEEYEVLAGKLVPPHQITIRDTSYNFNLHDPLEVLDAIATFAWWGNKKYPQYMEKYLSLLDPKLQSRALQDDKELNGQLFEEREVKTPTVDDDPLRQTMMYWVELQYNNKIYRIFVGYSSDGTEVYPGLSFTLVQYKNQWLQSDGLPSTIFGNFAVIPNYEEFIKTLR